MRSQKSSIPWLTLLFALMGLAWCGYVAFPTTTPPPCATSGCALFRDTRFAGVSLWWVGGLYFFALSVVCLRGNRLLARLFAMLALFLDALLLLIMFLTAPCFDCLVVALFFGLGYYSLLGSPDSWFSGEPRPSLLLPLWFGLFLGNCVLAANEMLPTYSLGSQKTADVRLYFSPSCPACREAVKSVGDKAVLYPVLEGEGDFDAILRFEALLERGLPVQEAFTQSLDPLAETPQPLLRERLLIAAQLLRNKASLLRQGFRALPLIQVNGMPGHRSTSLEKAANGRPGGGRAAVAPDAGPGDRPDNRQDNRQDNRPDNRQDSPRAAPPPDAAPQAPVTGYEPETPPEGWNATAPDPYAPPPAAPDPAAPGGTEPLPGFLEGVDELQQCGAPGARPCE